MTFRFGIVTQETKMSEGDIVTLTVQNNKADVELNGGRWAIIVDGVPNADKHVKEVEVTAATRHNACTAACDPPS